jgi:hypothetical protein
MSRERIRQDKMKLARIERWLEENKECYVAVGVETYFTHMNRAERLREQIAKMEVEFSKKKDRGDYWKEIDKNAKKLKKATEAVQAFELAKEIMTLAMQLQEYDLNKKKGA